MCAEVFVKFPLRDHFFDSALVDKESAGALNGAGGHDIVAQAKSLAALLAQALLLEVEQNIAGCTARGPEEVFYGLEGVLDGHGTLESGALFVVGLVFEYRHAAIELLD